MTGENDIKEQVMGLTGKKDTEEEEEEEGYPLHVNCPLWVACQQLCTACWTPICCCDQQQGRRDYTDECARCVNSCKFNCMQTLCRPLAAFFYFISDWVFCCQPMRLVVKGSAAKWAQWTLLSRCWWSSVNALMCIQCNPAVYWMHPCQALWGCWPLYDCVCSPVLTLPYRLGLLVYNLTCVLPAACCCSCLRVSNLDSESQPLNSTQSDSERIIKDTFSVGPPFGIGSGGFVCLPPPLTASIGSRLAFVDCRKSAKGAVEAEVTHTDEWGPCLLVCHDQRNREYSDCSAQSPFATYEG